MSLLATVSSILPTVDPDPYSPATMATDLAAGVATVLPWVGAGVGAGVVLMFAFMGIRKGFAFFKKVAN